MQREHANLLIIGAVGSNLAAAGSGSHVNLTIPKQKTLRPAAGWWAKDKAAIAINPKSRIEKLLSYCL